MVINISNALEGFLIEKKIISKKEFEEYCEKFELVYNTDEEGEDN